MRAADVERLFRQLDSPRRRRALAALGRMKGYARPRWQKGLRLEIVGDIDVADARGRIVKSADIEATVACNPHVDNITVTNAAATCEARCAFSMHCSRIRRA